MFHPLTHAKKNYYRYTILKVLAQNIVEKTETVLTIFTVHCVYAYNCMKENRSSCLQYQFSKVSIFLGVLDLHDLYKHAFITEGLTSLILPVFS